MEKTATAVAFLRRAVAFYRAATTSRWKRSVVGSLAWGPPGRPRRRRATIMFIATMFMATAVCRAMPSVQWNLVMCFLMGFEIVSLEVTAGDDIAFARALLRCGTRGELEQNPDNRLRLTIGLRKDGGRWVVAHEHHSFPDQD